MIIGKVANQEAMIGLEVAGPTHPGRQIKTVIDTGYNGYLTLPGHLISALKLPFAGHRRATLADGTVTVLDIHMATVVWYGRHREVLVSQTAGSPLIGMSMLRGSQLSMHVVEGGDVRVKQLSASG